MGLFSGLLRVVSPVAGAIIGAKANKKAINKANAATQLGLTNATNTLNGQLATTTANFAPYTGAGTAALGQQQDILGLNGTGAQGSIIDQLKASPYFQSLFRTGEETILGNASATGGLRGGNVQSSLANFGSDTLAQTIQQQLANLSPLVQTGMTATDTLGRLGANNAQQIAGYNVDSGRANAGSVLDKLSVSNKMFSDLQGMLQSAVAGGAGGVPMGGAGGAGGGFDPSTLLSGIFGPGYSIKEPWGQQAPAPNIPISLPPSLRRGPVF